MDAVYKQTLGDYTVKLYQDTDAESPMNWDGNATFCLFHGRYQLGHPRDISTTQFSGWDEVQDYLVKHEHAVAILPVYMYDHGGITINTTGFSCPWDSGQIGFVYITREQMADDWGWKRLSKSRKERLNLRLLDDVRTYDQYLSGQVYGYVIEDQDGEHIDSCWGYYGYNYAKTTAIDALEQMQ